MNRCGGILLRQNSFIKFGGEIILRGLLWTKYGVGFGGEEFYDEFGEPEIYHGVDKGAEADNEPNGVIRIGSIWEEKPLDN